ncbi:thioredoxin family protein [Candidatus Berkelbacteria bacterium]|nr:thioredoxin family protein [Candidatus Berkelbacteria bacterium]
MKKLLLAFLAIGVISLLVFFITKPKFASDAVSQQQSKNTPNPISTNGQNNSTNQQSGKYIDYTASAIDQNKGTKILFFHAPWCPQCRALDASIKSGTIPNNTTIIKVDYDSNQDLRQKYGITIQTTLVLIDDSGKLIKKYVAYQQPILQAVIDNLL